GAAVQDRIGRGDVRQRRGDDLVPAADPRQHECQLDRRRATVGQYRLTRPHVLGKFLLKQRGLAAQQQPPGTKHANHLLDIPLGNRGLKELNIHIRRGYGQTPNNAHANIAAPSPPARGPDASGDGKVNHRANSSWYSKPPPEAAIEGFVLHDLHGAIMAIASDVAGESWALRRARGRYTVCFARLQQSRRSRRLDAPRP